ncbi:unnamed protein product [Ambrosiozyma monospora]|uniref:Unnamed protein product n=1 Tax=Ambrosiozyma monospora TaxID=43982 RepID=A0A9W7DCV8_AMBMO|nr:unnamed protein product [Ambrosiozyma monospora]
MDLFFAVLGVAFLLTISMSFGMELMTNFIITIVVSSIGVIAYKNWNLILKPFDRTDTLPSRKKKYSWLFKNPGKVWRSATTNGNITILDSKYKSRINTRHNFKTIGKLSDEFASIFIEQILLSPDRFHSRFPALVDQRAQYYQTLGSLFLEKLDHPQRVNDLFSHPNSLFANIWEKCELTGLHFINFIIGLPSIQVEYSLTTNGTKSGRETIVAIERRLFKLMMAISFNVYHKAEFHTSGALFGYEKESLSTVWDFCNMDWICFTQKHPSLQGLKELEFENGLKKLCTNKHYYHEFLRSLLLVSYGMKRERCVINDDRLDVLLAEFYRLLCCLILFVYDPSLFDNKSPSEVSKQVDYDMEVPSAAPASYLSSDTKKSSEINDSGYEEPPAYSLVDQNKSVSDKKSTTSKIRFDQLVQNPLVTEWKTPMDIVLTMDELFKRSQ